MLITWKVEATDEEGATVKGWGTTAQRAWESLLGETHALAVTAKRLEEELGKLPSPDADLPFA
jgi:hypothetical protein